MSRCIIIGNASLALACARILERDGHEVVAFVADEGTPARRARAAGLPVMSSIESLLSAAPADVDFLFSIANVRVLSAQVLAVARIAAINYHDGPLPRYSGLNAPVFALLAGERQHGISWHLMEGGVDEGGVLRQPTFAISAADSALTVNTRCFETALQEFEKLSAALPSLPPPIYAPLDAATACPRGRRPPNGAVIDWSKPATEIAHLVRSLDHGSYANPVACAKTSFRAKVLLVVNAEAHAAPSLEAPGTVLRTDAGGVTIATGEGQLQGVQFLDVDGTSYGASTLASLGILPGARLDSPSAEVKARLDHVHRMLGKHEGFWLRRLERLDLAELPGAAAATSPSPPISHDIPVPEGVTEAEILATTVAWLARTTGKGLVDVGLVHDSLDGLRTGVEAHFAPVVPLRIEHDDSFTFAEFEKRTAADVTMLRDRGTWAIDAPARQSGLRPVPQVRFDVVVRLGTNEAVPGASLTCVVSKHELTWWIDSARVSSEAFDRLRAQYLTLAEAAHAAPNGALGTLPTVPELERQKLLLEWNATQAPWPSDKVLHQLIAEQVARTPDAVAAVFDSQRVTYRELDERANRLAHRLRRLGVGRDSIVGLQVRRSIRLLEGVLGIAKAGGAYLPLDPAYPPDRLSYMVEDSGANIIVSEEGVLQGLDSGNRTVVLLDQAGTPGDARSPLPPTELATPSSLAYVIYTSGSTGRPKGVMVEHRNIMNFFVGMDARIGTTPGVWLAVTSLSFDISVLELLWTLARGFTVVVYREPDRHDRFNEERHGHALTVPALIQAHGVTHLQCTPSTVAMLLLEAGATESFRHLQRLLVGGEALPPTLAKQLVELVGGEVHNMYGPTETTVWSTSHRLAAADSTPALGRPIANTHLLVLDEARRLVPIGTPGELYIGGEGVVRGYLNRPELTAERFIKNPFASVAPRLYRTGDLVCLGHDGVLHFIGRADSQVKLRGHRIELGEIEQRVRQMDGVLDAVAIVREDTPGDQRLVAYVVTLAGSAFDSQHVRDLLKGTVPDYMVPSHIVEIDAIPLTPNRKVDRKALPVPVAFSEQSRGAPARPGIETELARIWSELLGVPEPGREANFFDLGGHSLLAMQVHQRLRERFPEHGLTVTDLFRFPTIAALGGLLSADAGESETGGEVPRPEPVYFGTEGRFQFGMLHRARQSPSRGAILCCYPLPPEYMFCHRAFQRLAATLSMEGFDVLRFDHSGVGDSAGDPGDATIEAWAAEVETALNYLRLRTDATRISIVGLRLGAALAAMASKRPGAIDRLVLWEPVLDGRDYVCELAKLAGVHHESGSAPTTEFDVCGFPVTAQLQRGLAAIAPSGHPPRAARTLLLTSKAGVTATWTTRSASIVHEVEPGFTWSRSLIDDMVVVPPAHLDLIVRFLCSA